MISGGHFLYSRVFVDAVTILGLGIGLKYLNSQNTKEVVKNMKGITMEGGWEKYFLGSANYSYGDWNCTNALWLLHFLKLVVCGCSLYYAYHLYEKKDQTFTWVFVFCSTIQPYYPSLFIRETNMDNREYSNRSCIYHEERRFK